VSTAVRLTRAQREALLRVFVRTVEDLDVFRLERHRAVNSVRDPKVRLTPELKVMYRKFRRTVQPGPDCVMVKFAGMWLGIEPDGHTHS
jgi:hypothetical protein